MKHRAVLVLLLVVTPGVLHAQETKLVNCRTFEAAGYFVGPEEVLDGDRVCKKVKPGTADLQKTEAEKSDPVQTAQDAVLPGSAPVSVAEAAEANAVAKAKKAGEKAADRQKSAVVVAPSEPLAEAAPVVTPPPVRVPPVVESTPVPAQWSPAVAVTPAPVQPLPEATSVASPPPVRVPPVVESTPVPAQWSPAVAVAPAPAQPLPEATPVASPPPLAAPDPRKLSAEPVEEPASAVAFPSAVAPVVAQPSSRMARKTAPAVEPGPPPASVPPPVSPTHAVSASSADSAPAAAPAHRIRRDAPLAPGTPAEPPEKDYGFSDANAVEAPAEIVGATNLAANARRVAQGSGASVKLGAFDTPREAAAGTAAANQAQGEHPPVAGAYGQRAGCAKNITLGTLRDEKLSLGVPGWAEKWIAKNQKRLTNVCFSSAPMKDVENYLIVFYSAPANGQGQSDANAALPLPDATVTGGAGGFTAKDGSTWHYAAESNPGAAFPVGDPASGGSGEASAVWYATAYTADGVPVAERWPESSKHGDVERASEDLLNTVVEDVRKL